MHQVFKAADIWGLGVIIFMMLTGRAPFDGETDDDLFDAILSGDYKWPSSPRVSDHAKDLVRRMLTMDHTRRITAFDALKHQWLDQHVEVSENLNGVVKALSDFSAAAKFKKAIATLMLNHASTADSLKLHRLFDELDTDGDRLLDLPELVVYMRHHGYDSDEKAKQAAMVVLEGCCDGKPHRVRLQNTSQLMFHILNSYFCFSMPVFH
jgi:calcium-dependent protein kinase